LNLFNITFNLPSEKFRKLGILGKSTTAGFQGSKDLEASFEFLSGSSEHGTLILITLQLVVSECPEIGLSSVSGAVSRTNRHSTTVLLYLSLSFSCSFFLLLLFKFLARGTGGTTTCSLCAGAHEKRLNFYAKGLTNFLPIYSISRVLFAFLSLSLSLSVYVCNLTRTI